MPDHLVPAAPTATGYRANAASRWPLLAVVVAIHCAGFALIGYLGAPSASRRHDRILSVRLFDLAPPKPVQRPPARDLPVERIVSPRPAVPAVVVLPPPIVQPRATDAPPVATTQTPPPAIPATTPPAAPLAVAKPADPVSDLNARLLAATPPRYPVESRRRRETGVVVLMVDLGEDGRVSQIAVARSSGHDRLDQAALRAVRGWRWSPTLVEGRAAPLRGLVRIPFVLAT